ncbi:hypothetical protein ABW19_dt0203218 [Dactylella cylindrospora]|nr:hypothetical protein ABW19_dt0203218 [Dactylella cylindrospora]
MRTTSWLPVGLALCSIFSSISGYAIQDKKEVVEKRGFIVTWISDTEALASQLGKRQEDQPSETPTPSRTRATTPTPTPDDENPPSLSQSDEEASAEPTEKPSSTQRSTPSPTEEESRPESTSETASAESTNEKPTESAVEVTTTGDGQAQETTVAPDPNGLPYTPPLTPAFAFAGFLLLVAGIPYTLAGVRHKQIHIFLSTALLASLGVTVLIIYVMNPPVSNSLQGGYVAAIAITGLILGGLAVIFPEVTEVLACLLGGFCLAQWFLVLQPGGLVKGGWEKIVFILCFSIGLFCLALHHKTRPYGMIFSIAFSGATVTVLGIDFFSRAGLKEFWLYVWGLNDNIFPLGTDTFPMTRGIKVEIAAIVVITCFGIISQMKLWQVIKEKRSQREEARRQREADIEAMEAENGRRVEETAQRERELWEKQYGDKGKLSAEDENSEDKRKHLSRDSGLGQSSKHSSDGESSKNGVNESIEMVGLEKAAGTAMEPPTISVTEPGAQQDEITPVNATTEPPVPVPTPVVQMPEPRFFAPAVVIREKGDVEEPASPVAESQNGVPGITTVHTVIVDPKKEDDDDDASSLATFADSVRDDKRKSMAMTIASIPALDDIQEIPHHDDAASSVAGTIDDDDDDRSDMEVPLVGEDNGKRRSVISLSGHRNSWASGKRLSIISLSRKNSTRSNKSNGPLSPTSRISSPRIPDSTAEDVKDDKSDLQSVLDAALNLTPEAEKETSRRLSLISGPEPEREPSRRQSIMSGPELTVPGAAGESIEERALSRKSSTSSFRQGEPETLATPKDVPEPAERPLSRKSSKSTPLPPPTPLRQESLQHVRPPSRIVKTYRVSEWAKHLDPADEPQMDDIEAIEPNSSVAAQEVAAPVHVMELQEGATSKRVMPPSAELGRSNTVNTLQAHGMSRSNTLTTIREAPVTQAQPTIIQTPAPIQAPSSPQIPTVVIASPAPSIRSAQLQMSSPILSQPLVESPTEDQQMELPQSNPSPTPQLPQQSMGETLLSKRESMLKAIPSMSPVLDNGSTFSQAPTQVPTFPPSTISPASSTVYLPQRHSMTGSPYLVPQRNSSGTTYASSMMSGIGPSGRMTSLDNHPMQPMSMNPYYNQLNTGSSPALSPLIPAGALETGPAQPPQPSPADRRESMLRAWRESLAQDQVISARTKNTMQDRRNLMLQEHALMSAHERQKEFEKGVKENIADERFRNKDMHAMHREAMKRMQERAKGI